MSLRRRVGLLVALSVLLAVAAASTVAWIATRSALRSQIDTSLGDGGPGVRFGGAITCPTAALPVTTNRQVFRLTIINADGVVCSTGEAPRVTISAADRAVAKHGGKAELRDAHDTTGTHVRVAVRALSRGGAVVLARPLTEVDRTLRRLLYVLLVVGAAGAVVAGLAGRWVARSGLRPVERLTSAVEDIGRTRDLSATLPVQGADEVARLAGAFNAMTNALADGRERQARLVADAGHELRTPLTSMLTNVELLADAEDAPGRLGVEDRRELLGDLKGQAIELSALIADLVDLARPEEVAPEAALLDLDLVVAQAVKRVRARAGKRVLTVNLAPTRVLGRGPDLERAVVNLLDNAVKFSPDGSRIEVSLSEGRLQISDEGQGVPERWREQVFERFWRAPSVRELPGSGLGLSIVAQVVAEHGGSVTFGAGAGGGASVLVDLPVA